MATRPVPVTGYECLTVQVRAGLGERRLVDAVRSLLVRHEELRADGVTAESCVHRVGLPSCLVQLAAVDDGVPGGPPLRVVWFDGGPVARVALVVRHDVLVRLPWQVLLPALVSAWKACPQPGLQPSPQPSPQQAARSRPVRLAVPTP
ncbi:hypothetical protein [Saccharothrix hoggarensis]|uniref:Condensation domain-containing protein n=1 Tax=Saccharothrix hoggarensis TaxID=913853 RepID=A0ABW3QYU8_9PSEU